MLRRNHQDIHFTTGKTLAKALRLSWTHNPEVGSGPVVKCTRSLNSKTVEPDTIIQGPRVKGELIEKCFLRDEITMVSGVDREAHGGKHAP